MSDEDKITWRERLQNLREIYITGNENRIIEEVKGSLPTEGSGERRGGRVKVDDDTYQREIRPGKRK